MIEFVMFVKPYLIGFTIGIITCCLIAQMFGPKRNDQRRKA